VAQWSSLTGVHYELQVSTNLMGWTTVANSEGNGLSQAHTNALSGDAHAFYRLRLTPGR